MGTWSCPFITYQLWLLLPPKMSKLNRLNKGRKIYYLAFYKKVSDSLYLHCFDASAAKSLQSCLTLCDPIDGSSSGSPVPGILQARTLEWVAISFSNA